MLLTMSIDRFCYWLIGTAAASSILTTIVMVTAGVCR